MIAAERLIHSNSCGASDNRLDRANVIGCEAIIFLLEGCIRDVVTGAIAEQRRTIRLCEAFRSGETFRISEDARRATIEACYEPRSCSGH